MTRGVFLSVGLTAAVQAALGLIGFLVLGVPHAGTLSALMFFLALVPGGVALVWAPYVVGADGKLVYHGRIDENYEEPTKVTSPDLKNALDQILAGQAVSKTETKAFGCTIKRA